MVDTCNCYQRPCLQPLPVSHPPLISQALFDLRREIQDDCDINEEGIVNMIIKGTLALQKSRIEVEALQKLILEAYASAKWGDPARRLWHILKARVISLERDCGAFMTHLNCPDGRDQTFNSKAERVQAAKQWWDSTRQNMGRINEQCGRIAQMLVTGTEGTKDAQKDEEQPGSRATSPRHRRGGKRSGHSTPVGSSQTSPRHRPGTPRSPRHRISSPSSPRAQSPASQESPRQTPPRGNTPRNRHDRHPAHFPPAERQRPRSAPSKPTDTLKQAAAVLQNPAEQSLRTGPCVPSSSVCAPCVLSS